MLKTRIERLLKKHTGEGSAAIIAEIVGCSPDYVRAVRSRLAAPDANIRRLRNGGGYYYARREASHAQP